MRAFYADQMLKMNEATMMSPLGLSPILRRPGFAITFFFIFFLRPEVSICITRSPHREEHFSMQTDRFVVLQKASRMGFKDEARC